MTDTVPPSETPHRPSWKPKKKRGAGTGKPAPAVIISGANFDEHFPPPKPKLGAPTIFSEEPSGLRYRRGELSEAARLTRSRNFSLAYRASASLTAVLGASSRANLIPNRHDEGARNKDRQILITNEGPTSKFRRDE
jgi:hypothetical protein